MNLDTYARFNSFPEKRKMRIVEAYSTYYRIKKNLKDKTIYDNIPEELHPIMETNTLYLRQLSNATFDATNNKFFTGLYSLELTKAVERHGYSVVAGSKKKNFPAHERAATEHPIGRNHNSRWLLEIEGIMDFKQFLDCLFETSFVIYTTAQENMNLRAFDQNNDWTLAYEQAGIVLCTHNIKKAIKRKSISKQLIDYKIITYDEIRENFEEHHPYYYMNE